MTPEEQARSLANLKLERDAVVLYERLAAIDPEPRRAAAFQAIAANECLHADIWTDRLRKAGVVVPHPSPPRWRIRLVVAIARLFGTASVSDLVRSLEDDEEEAYLAQDLPGAAAMLDDERLHAEVWRQLDAGDLDAAVAVGGRARAAGYAEASDETADRHTAHELGPRRLIARPAREERWHVTGRSGTLRASIFGISDGLVSNLALVMGVVGADADDHVIVLAGVAGLLAGAFSMGAGEWISMQSQRELFERQIALERDELRIMPEQEEAELAAIYRRKGIPDEVARTMAAHLMEDPEVALDTKVREELGLDPDELGSPWGAALGSFLAFTIGAAVPVMPYLVADGTTAFLASLVLSLGALFLVGAAVSLLTGRAAVFSGLRQMALGGLAAAVTYLVGSIIGVVAA